MKFVIARKLVDGLASVVQVFILVLHTLLADGALVEDKVRHDEKNVASGKWSLATRPMKRIEQNLFLIDDDVISIVCADMSLYDLLSLISTCKQLILSVTPLLTC